MNEQREPEPADAPVFPTGSVTANGTMQVPSEAIVPSRSGQVIDIDLSLAQSVERLLAGEADAGDIRSDLQRLIDQAVSAERSRMQAAEADTARLALLEGKVSRLAKSLEKTERQRDEYQQMLAAKAQSDRLAVPGRSRTPGRAERTQAKRFDLLMAILEENRAIRDELGINLSRTEATIMRAAMDQPAGPALERRPGSPAVPVPVSPVRWQGEDATLPGMSATAAISAAVTEPIAQPLPRVEAVTPQASQQVTDAVPAGMRVDPAITDAIQRTHGGAQPAARWTGEDATLAGVGERVTSTGGTTSARWTGDDRTGPNTAKLALTPAPTSIVGTARWTGEDNTLAGPATDSDQKPTQPMASTSAGPITTVSAVPGSPPSEGRLRQRSDRMRQADPASEERWLNDGRSGELTGRKLGDFAIGAILGVGGMGTVYKARQASVGRRAALKAMAGGMTADQTLVRRFEAEAHAGAVLSTPHVVQVYGAGREQGVLFFAMEFVEGSDLRRLIDDHRAAGTRPTTVEAARLVLHAGRGLAEAGRHGIVHRDIKPQNLLLTPNNTVKVADFGIAKLMGEQALTLAGATVGTPAYASPEQGRGAEVDERSDLYSLGVVLYELLTLRKPFQGDTPDALIYQHNYAEPKPPSQVVEGLPSALEAICMRLLMKDPAKRYQDAGALVADLDRFLAGSEPALPAFDPAFGTGADEAMERYLPRRRRLWTVVAIASAAVFALVIGLWWLQTSAEVRGVERDEGTRRRQALQVLDTVAPVPASAAADLAWLRARLPAGDPALVRWSAKLERIETLRASLSALDTAGDVAWTERTAARRNLGAYVAEVGESDAAAHRWRARLDAMSGSEAALRGDLRALDAEPLPVPVVDRLQPQLLALGHLVDAADGDLVRWRQRSAAARARLAGLAERLAVLDGSPSLGEARLHALADDLDAWIATAPADDPRAGPWKAALAAATAEFTRLRDHLSRLDGVEFATIALQADIAADLAAYRARAEPDDPRLRAWDAKIAASNNLLSRVRDQLAGLLDTNGPLGSDAVTTATRLLADYRALVSPDDGRLLAWDRRLAADAQERASLEATASHADDPRRLTAGEVEAVDAAITSLAGRGALVGEALDRRRAVVAAARARLNALRKGLAAGPDSATARAAAADLAVSAPDDAALAAFQREAATWARLRGALAVLDQVAPPPEGISAVLADYAARVPATDAAVVRWRARMAAIASARQALGWAESPAEPPADAAGRVDDLERLVGPDDPLVGRARARLRALAGLMADLASAETILLLPASSPLPARIDEIATLVGETPRVVAARGRLRTLAGPPAPWAAATGHDEHGPWAEADLGGGQRLRLRWIPPGAFQLGSPADERGRDADEGPLPCTLSQGLWIGETEVTQAQWQAVGAANPSRFLGADRPVDSVRLDEARAFCDKLAARLAGLRARLPSEAEWEWAARAGVAGAVAGPAGDLGPAALDQVAWFDRSDGTHPVALRQPNRFGLHDCLGNVWEWTRDGYQPYPGGAVTDPRPEAGAKRVVRGGGWSDAAGKVRLANRVAVEPDLRSRLVGLRIAADP